MTRKQCIVPGHAPRLAAAGFVAAVGLALAGCGGGSGSSSPPAATTSASAAPTASATSSAGGQGTTVLAEEVDFKINLSMTAFKPGTYTFVVRNSGQATHALEIEGPGVEERKTDTVSPGASTMLTVTLQKGRYELYCPVDGHKGLGMETHITVA
jgi:uncharacterized cupredoxin-like copper-binding protein